MQAILRIEFCSLTPAYLDERKPHCGRCQKFRVHPTAGTQALTRHIRDGRELPELNRDNHYSTHFQEIRLLKRPVRVLPVIVHAHNYTIWRYVLYESMRLYQLGVCTLLRLRLIDFCELRNNSFFFSYFSSIMKFTPSAGWCSNYDVQIRNAIQRPNNIRRFRYLGRDVR